MDGFVFFIIFILVTIGVVIKLLVEYYSTPIWERGSEQKRLCMVEKISDEQHLLQIVLSASSNIAMVALKKINNPELLKIIVLKKDISKLQETAIKQISDQTMLQDIALDNSIFETARTIAINKLTDQTVLELIATEDCYDFNRKSAFKKLKDKETFLKNILRTEDTSIWEKIFNSCTKKQIISACKNFNDTQKKSIYLFFQIVDGVLIKNKCAFSEHNFKVIHYIEDSVYDTDEQAEKGPTYRTIWKCTVCGKTKDKDHGHGLPNWIWDLVFKGKVTGVDDK